MMKATISCEDRYEAQKLASLIFIKEGDETFITGILNAVSNEVIISVKDKSAHSILLKTESDVEKFADFAQSVIEGEHRITSTGVIGDRVDIVKG